MDRADKFIIGELLGDVFGIQSPIYLPWGESRRYESRLYPGIKVLDEEESKVLSWMGTPVMGTFSLMGGTYKTYDEKGQLVTMQVNDYLMPYATIVEFSRAMNVTKTKAIGSKGTVKEIYGIDDWVIAIKGICLNDDSRITYKTAQEQLTQLLNFRKITDTINVQGAIFNDKDIYGLVIDDLKITPVQGKYNVIAFEIQATSDNVIELML